MPKSSKEREPSDILAINPNYDETQHSVEDVAIDQLLQQKERLLDLVKQIDADLKSLGYSPSE